MRVHILQHVSFEGPGKILDWCIDREHEIAFTKFFEEGILPELSDIDMLVIMGGPMSVNDENLHPWLKREKGFISRVLSSQIPVIGICLGAQLIAAAAGCRVYPGGVKEIGWFPVKGVEEKRVDKEMPGTAAAALFPSKFTPLHWHGETFDLPAEGVLLASSEAYPHQAFLLGGNVIALQFHLEMDSRSLASIVENCGDELVPGNYIQREDVLRSPDPQWMDYNHGLLYRILDEIST